MVLLSQIIVFSVMVGLFIESFRRDPLKMTQKKIAIISLLMVISIVLGTYLKVSIPLLGPETFELKFDILPVFLIGMWFGSSWGLLAGLLIDLLQLILFPVGFPFLGFTLNLMLAGYLGGLFLKHPQKKFKLKDSFLVLALVFSGCLFYILQFDTTMQIKLFAIVVALLSLISLMVFLQWFLKRHDDYKGFVQQWMITILVYELLVDWLLTSLWLWLLFKIDMNVLFIARIPKAYFLIILQVFIGLGLYRLIVRHYHVE